MRYRIENNLEEIISAQKVLQRLGASQRLMQKIRQAGRLVDENERTVALKDKIMPFEP